jgi:hypothetical protein
MSQVLVLVLHSFLKVPISSSTFFSEVPSYIAPYTFFFGNINASQITSTSNKKDTWLYTRRMLRSSSNTYGDTLMTIVTRTWHSSTKTDTPWYSDILNSEKVLNNNIFQCVLIEPASSGRTIERIPTKCNIEKVHNKNTSQCLPFRTYSCPRWWHK